ncbi:MAG: DUF11 domain-containing protein [Clostridiales Family XIII bacterium]|nr:DUF11 domain-containing protein [Clostridiales Family XIII bacterium]
MGITAFAATALLTAQVLPQDGSGPLPEDTGSREAPVAVDIGDEIEYTITVQAPGHEQGPPPRYDMLFVLDWSASMDAGYASPGQNPVPSRVLAKDAILAVCARVLEEYPDSRVAVMGLNSSGSNTGDPMYTNLQVDTDFVAADRYEEVIATAFEGGGYPPNVGQDDNATYIRAAREKLQGNTWTSYGGYSMPPNQHVNPRADRSRTPLIVHISDFEIDDPPDYTSSFGGYWRMKSAYPHSLTDSLNARIIEYRQAYPDGIYIAVRTDHYDHYDAHPQFRSPYYNQLMAGTAGLSDLWSWMSINMNNYQSQAEDLAGMIREAAPIVKIPVTVTDLLPAGLSFAGSEPGAVVADRGGRSEVVFTAEIPEGGAQTFTVRARVDRYGTFENKAAVIFGEDAPAETNSAWHRATDPAPPRLHIRQATIERIGSAVPLPQTGYWMIETGVTVIPVITRGAAYTSVVLPLAEGGMTCAVRCAVPQYYAYAGHVVTSGDTPHDPAQRAADLPALDFTEDREQWLTVYLRPVTDTPAPHARDTRTNRF